jgi:hypothetical protein
LDYFVVMVRTETKTKPTRKLNTNKVDLKK